MTFESLLLTIEGSLAIGGAIGLLVGFALPRPKIGCIALLIVPVAMICFISWWQGQYPENVRSTSGLDFVFGPIWPSLGALGGYFIGVWLRTRFGERG